MLPIPELLARVSLEAEVSRVTHLTKAGKNKVACCPFHRETTPSFTVYPQGKFHCFGCGEHGDAIDFTAKIRNMSASDARDALERENGLDGYSPAPASQAKPKTEWNDFPPPAGTEPPDTTGYDLVHTYYDESGAVIRHVCRKHLPNGKKKFSQLTYGRLDGVEGWHWKGPNAPSCLYGLDYLAQAPRAIVIVCEGEKGADAAQALFPDRVAVTWSGGASTAAKADWLKLSGRNVIIWPDNDEPGLSASAVIIKILQPITKNLAIMRVDDLAIGADAADVAPENPVEWMKERLTKIGAPPPDMEFAPPPESHGPLDWDQELEQKIRQFNQKYAIVNENGDVTIFQTAYDDVSKRERINRLSVQDFQTLYSNEKIQADRGKNGAPIYKSVAAVWLVHPLRRQYIDGVTFNPTTHKEIPGVLNLWKGYAVKPKAGDWSILRSHIRDIICDGAPERFEYLMGWMASLLQFPARQGEVAVVMRSGEGTGKGTLAKALLTVIGQHGLAISNAKHLVGNFNGHLRDAIFLFADEAFFAGDRAHIGVLKSIITEPYLTIEAKYQNATQVPNYLHIIMASNEEWVVPASVDARRFFVLDVNETVKNNHEYFGLLWDQMKAGGYEAMLHDLLALDLSDFNIRAVPKTAALQEQQKLSLSVPFLWWKDCLERGYVYKSKLGLEALVSTWHDFTSTELLYDSYKLFAAGKHERQQMSREALGRFMVKTGAKAARLKAIVGEHLTNETNAYGTTTRVAKVIEKPKAAGYVIGSLDLTREAFCAVTALNVDWDKDEIAENPGKSG